MEGINALELYVFLHEAIKKGKISEDTPVVTSSGEVVKGIVFDDSLEYLSLDEKSLIFDLVVKNE